MVCAGVVAPAIFARESAIWPKTSFSCCAIPFVVSTRFGIKSLRRCSWFSTCAHCVLIPSSWPTNLLYEHPEDIAAAVNSNATNTVDRICLIMPSDYHHPLAPPPPLRPPPKPPKPPPPNPPPPPPPQPPPPNGPTPLFQPLHPPVPQPP